MLDITGCFILLEIRRIKEIKEIRRFSNIIVNREQRRRRVLHCISVGTISDSNWIPHKLFVLLCVCSLIQLRVMGGLEPVLATVGRTGH